MQEPMALAFMVVMLWPFVAQSQVEKTERSWGVAKPNKPGCQTMKSGISSKFDEHKADHDSAVGVLPRHRLRRQPLLLAYRHLMRVSLQSLLVVGILSTVSSAHATRYEFDPRRTEVRFAFTMAYATQRGRFTKVTGVLDYADNAPEKSKVTAAIDAASVSIGDALVENQLRGAEFFNVEAAPVIAFKSVKVEPRSATTADVTGDVTINGIKQPVVLKVRITPHDDPALKYDTGSRRFVATTRIQRSAFNMTAYESFVGDDIELVIDAIVRPRRKRRKQ